MNYYDDRDKKYAAYGIDKDTVGVLHNYLCEIMPSVAEDSGQAEWTQGELDKFMLTMLQILNERGYINSEAGEKKGRE